jgi:hypothetical protein
MKQGAMDMNTTCRLTAVLLAAFGAFVPPAAAQRADPNRQPLTPEQVATRSPLLAAVMKVQLEIRLDRQEYLAGEAARATLSAFNPAPEPLLAPDPFDRAYARCLDLEVWRDVPGWEWFSTSPEEGCEGLNLGAPTIMLGPGQRIEKTIPSADFAWKLPPPPISAGRYRLVFGYGRSHCAHAEFTVVEPIFRGSAAIMLAELGSLQYAKDGPVTRYPRYIQAFILEYDGRRYIGLQRRPESFEPTLNLTPGRKLDGGRAQFLGAFDRIAEAGMDANSLQLEADAQENITVTWNESGQARSNCVSSDRTRIESCKASLVPPVQISVDPPTKALGVSESKHFLVSIAGTSNTEVRWSIALGPGAPPSAEPGTVSAEGVYEAPHSIPSPYTVIVTAQSQADRTKSTSATVTLAPR